MIKFLWLSIVILVLDCIRFTVCSCKAKLEVPNTKVVIGSTTRLGISTFTNSTVDIKNKVLNVTIGDASCYNLTLSNSTVDAGCFVTWWSCELRNSDVTGPSGRVQARWVGGTLQGPVLELVAFPRILPFSTPKLRTFVRGGLQLTLRGVALTEAYNVSLFVDRENDGTHRPLLTLCDVKSYTSAVCLYPDMGSGHYEPVQHEGARKHDHNTHFSVTVLVWTRRSGELRFNTNTTLEVYIDPDFEEHDEPIIYRPNKHKILHIKGTYLSYAAKLSDFSVSLGVSNCSVTALYHNGLSCLPPPTQPKSALGGKLPQLMVRVGSLTRVIGYVRYEYYVPMNSDVTAGMAAGIAFAVLAVLTVIIVLAYRRRKVKKPMPVPDRMDLEDPAQWTNPGYVEGDRLPSRPGHVTARTRTVASAEGHRSLSVSTAESDLTSRLSVEAPSDASSVPRSVMSGASLPFEMRLHSEQLLALQDCEVDMGRLTLGEVVGQGTRITPRDVNSFLEEALVMKDFSHPHVLSLLGVCLDRKKPFVILPYMENGDLKSYITEPARRIKVRELLVFGKQVASGMCYLSQQKFVHRDLASRNCMVDTDLKVKIADFGLSRDIYKSNYYRVEDRQRPLPVKWMAIESLSQGMFSTKTDVWSFGVLLWELLTRGCPPYADIDGHKIKHFLQLGRRLEQPEHAPDAVYALMQSCWLEDPEMRPEFADLHRQIQEVLEADTDNNDLYARIT